MYKVPKSVTAEKQIRNAMQAAQWRGCDPYNSHDSQEREWRAVARVRAGMRSRSEAVANMELSMLLQRQCGDAEHHRQWYEW